MKGLSVLATLLLLLLAQQLAAHLRHSGKLPANEKKNPSWSFTQSAPTSTVPLQVYSL